MTPRYSLLGLIGCIAYCATAFAAIGDPFSLANAANIWAWLAILVYFTVIGSCTARDNASPFSRTFVICAILYFLADSQLQMLDESRVITPSGAVVDVVVGPRINEFDEDEIDAVAMRDVERYEVKRLIGMNCSIAFGTVSGWLAVWRKSRLLRRHSQQIGE